MTDWVTLRDQLNLTLKPIEAWPGSPTPAWQRDKGPFTAGLKDTLAVLRKEMHALSASAIVLQIAIKPQHMRLDGLPRAGATAEHPGVILAFSSTRGPLRIWFDKFLRWEMNLRAIALHLEHLRMATLYGVGEDGQAYRGWTALPPGSPVAGYTPSKIGVTGAIAVLLTAARMESTQMKLALVLSDREEARSLIREAQKATHPDRSGDEGAFRSVQEAAEALRKHHGL